MHFILPDTVNIDRLNHPTLKNKFRKYRNTFSLDGNMAAIINMTSAGNCYLANRNNVA